MTTTPKATPPGLEALAMQLSEVEQRMAARDGHLANDVNGLLNSVLLIEQRVAGLEAVVSGRLSNTDNLIRNLTAHDADVPGDLNRLLNSVATMEQRVASLESLVGGRLSNTDNLVGNLADITLALGPDLSAIRGTVAQLENRLANLYAFASTQSSGVMTKIDGAIAKTDNHFANTSQSVNALNERISSLTGQLANTDNRLANLNSIVVENAARIASIEGALANLANQLSNMVDAGASQREGLALLVARGTASLTSRAKSASTGKTRAPLPVPSLDKQMSEMRKAAPLNFDAWHRAYEVGVAEGRRTVEGNLSHEGHPGATYFRMFVNIHAKGPLLDVGCGPLPVPSYLADWPQDATAGIDPQAPFDEPHPFPFAVSFAEFIPWPDASFETVVIGTSLDHVYLLDKALSEVKRVLAPHARLLLWTAMFDQTEPYDPYRAKISQPDTYHLFHPGRNWFYQLLADDYRLIERMAVPGNAEFLAFQRR